MADYLFSGIFERFGDLKVAYSEGQIGWIPYLLHRMDVVWEENRGWGGVADKVPNPPSSYFPDHVYGCFFDDPNGLKLIDEIGADNITYESDYPLQGAPRQRHSTVRPRLRPLISRWTSATPTPRRRSALTFEHGWVRCCPRSLRSPPSRTGQVVVPLTKDGRPGCSQPATPAWTGLSRVAVEGRVPSSS